MSCGHRTPTFSSGLLSNGGHEDVGIPLVFEGSGGAIPTFLPQNGVARGAEPRPGPGREHGDCPKVANRTPPKLEKQADFPLRWSAVLENWRVERAGPLQISSSEHLRTGKTRFRTKHPKKSTRPHRPKANTNASPIELELVEKKLGQLSKTNRGTDCASWPTKTNRNIALNSS